MRDMAATIAALERKADDRAVTLAEREAILAKVAELRERYEPVPQASAPPSPPKPPRPPAPPTAGFGPWQSSTGGFGFNGTTTGTANTTVSNLWVRFS